MLFLLSPAKSLDYETPLSEVTAKITKGAPLAHTQPLFTKQSAELIEILRKISPKHIATLMSLSDPLAALNVARYEAWSPKFTAKNSRQAILAFDGDVYGGFNAKTLKQADLEWAQDHICILSGLYGVLRPLDWMQPYRLEMSTRLKNEHGHDLYKFWGSKLAEYLNERLAAEDGDKPVVINLASQEYFKAVDLKTLNARVIDIVFEEWKGGKFKIISFNAKRARGLMARYATQHRIKTPAGLRKFDTDGYAFDLQASDTDRLVFRRKL